MLAYERLLELHKEHRGKVTLIQVAVPSREQVTEYQQLKREIDELVGRINGRFGTSIWTPIRYINRSIAASRLSALYRDADVGLVTPLRDGMNLVAKEFVASQTDEPGVLVLSRLAGAAETMLEAITVNPYNVDSVADSIHLALSMPKDQRESRMRALQRREQRHDLHEWLDEFLGSATRYDDRMAPVRESDFESWLGAFVGNRRVALFLDFDGTLAPIASHPSKVAMSESMREVLEGCAKRPDTDVAIVSGRALEDIRKHVGMDGLVYAGNHGLEIEGGGLETFRHPDSRSLPRARARARSESRCSRGSGGVDGDEGRLAHVPLSGGAGECARGAVGASRTADPGGWLPGERRTLRRGGPTADRLGQGARGSARAARALRAGLVRVGPARLRGR